MNLQVIVEYGVQTAGGTCYLCKLPRRGNEKVIDTGVEIDFEGFLAICESCIRYCNSLLGGVTPEQQAAYNADLTAMTLEVEVARRFMAEHETRKAALEAEEAALRNALALIRGVAEEPARPPAKRAKAGT
jgi:hypothetical protein